MYTIFARLCKQHNVTAAQVSRETGIAQPTFTAWKKGQYTPKAEKLRLIAEYFGVSMEYLATGKDTPKDSAEGKTYYFSDETAQVAQEIFDDPNKHALFDAARNARPEDLRMAADLLERLKGTNPDG